MTETTRQRPYGAIPQPGEITVTGREPDSFDNPVREQEV